MPIDFQIDFEPDFQPETTEVNPEWEAERARLLSEQKSAARSGTFWDAISEITGGAESLIEGGMAAFSPSEALGIVERNVENLGSAIAGKRMELSPALKFSTTLKTPLIKIPEIPIAPDAPGYSQAAAGMLNAVGEFANFMQSPEGIALLGIGGLPKQLQKTVTAAFAGQMAGNAPQQFNEAVDAINAGDYGRAGKAIGSFAISSGMAAKLGGSMLEKPPMLKTPGVPTPEQLAQRADIVARNRMAPGTMRPGEIQQFGPVRHDPPPGMFEAQGPGLGEQMLPLAERVKRMRPQVFDLPPEAPRPTVIPPTEFPATETRGKVSFGSEAAAEGIPNARQQAPGGVVGGGRQPGIIEAVAAIARNPDRLSLEAMRSQIEKEIGAGVADASRNDLLRLIDSRLGELRTGKFNPELTSIRMTLGRGRPIIEAEPPPAREPAALLSEGVAEEAIAKASTVLPQAAKAAEAKALPEPSRQPSPEEQAALKAELDALQGTEPVQPQPPAPAPAPVPPTAGGPNASEVPPSTAFHGNVRPLETPPGVLPIQESGPRVQPPPGGGLPEARPEARPAQGEVLLRPVVEAGGEKFYGKTHEEALAAAEAAMKAGKITPDAFGDALVNFGEGNKFEAADGKLVSREEGAKLLREKFPGEDIPDNLHSQWLNPFLERKASEAAKVDFKPETAPEAAPAKAAFEPPRPPKISLNVPEQGKESAFQKWRDESKKYNEDLAAWEASIPQNERLIFEGDNVITFITREPTGGWRNTWVSKTDQMPTGHEVYKTRLEALKAVSSEKRIEKMPFEIKPLPERVAPMAKPATPSVTPQPQFLGRELSYWKTVAVPQKLGKGQFRTMLAKELGVKDTPAAVAKALQAKIAELESAKPAEAKQSEPTQGSPPAAPEAIAEPPPPPPEAPPAPPAPEPAKPAEAPAAPPAEPIKSAFEVPKEILDESNAAATELRNAEAAYDEAVKKFGHNSPEVELAKYNLSKANNRNNIAQADLHLAEWSESTKPFRGKKEVWNPHITAADLKAQQANLLAQIESALKEAPEEYQNDNKITFTVPGDGEFTLLNNKANLKTFKETVRKHFPKTVTNPLSVRENPTGLPRKAPEVGLGKGNGSEAEKLGKALSPFMSKDESRRVITVGYADGTQIIVTDGISLVRVITSDAPGTPEKPTRIGHDGKVNEKAASEGDFPNWKAVRDPDAQLILGGMDTESVWHIANQAWGFRDAALEKDKRGNIGLNLVLNKDGSIGGKMELPEGESFEHNVKPGAKNMGNYNPEYLANHMEIARKLGNDVVDVYAHSGEEGPIGFVGQNHEGLLMPMRGEKLKPRDPASSFAGVAGSSVHGPLPEGLGPLRNPDALISKTTQFKSGSVVGGLAEGSLTLEAVTEKKVPYSKYPEKVKTKIVTIPIDQLPKSPAAMAKTITEWFKDIDQPATQAEVKPITKLIKDIISEREDIIAEANKRKPYRASADEIAKKLDEWKAPTGKEGAVSVFGVTNVLWNSAIDVAKLAIRGGGTVADAIDAAVKHIRENFKGPWQEARARASIGLTLSTGINAANLKPTNVSPATKGASSFLQKVKNTAVTMAKTGDVRQMMAYLMDSGENAANAFGTQVANDVRNLLARELGRKTSVQKPAYANALQRRAWERQNNLDQEALAFMREAGEDAGTLRAMRNKLEASPDANPKWKARAIAAIDHALANFDAVKKASEEYGRRMDAQQLAETMNGLNTQYRKNYVPHIQELPNEFGIFEAGGSGNSSGFRHVRSFETLADSISAGVDPKSINAIDLLQRRVSAGHKLINNRAWIEGLRDTADPKTGNPIVTDVVKVPRGPGMPPDLQAPNGYRMEVAGGRPVAVLDGYAGIFDALTKPSYLSRNTLLQAMRKAGATGKHLALLLDTFHLGRMAAWQAIIKPLSFTDPKMPFPSYKKGVLALDYSPAELQRMANNGEINRRYLPYLLDTQAKLKKLIDAGYNIGGVADNLYSEWTHHIPITGAFNKWLFGQFQRGAMAEIGAIEFDRYKRMLPTLSEQEVARRVAKDLNVRFGTLNRQGILKSRTSQDLARLLFLAPQWNEGLIRSEVGAVTGMVRGIGDSIKNRRPAFGVLPRAIGAMIIGQFAANQLINFITRGKPTWENEEEGLGAKISAWIPDAAGGPGMFLHPMGLAAEITHLLKSKMERTQGDTQKTAMSFLGSRASTLARPAMVFGLRQDPFGRQLVRDDIYKEVAKAAIPLPIPTRATVGAVRTAITGERTEEHPGQFQRQILSSMGIKTDQAPSNVQRMYALAREFNAKDGVEETGVFPQNKYSDITRYLTIGNRVAARKELETLLKEEGRRNVVTHFERWLDAPFTRQKDREIKFFKSLSPEQKQAYREAIKEKMEVWKRLIALLRESRGAK